MLFMFFAAVMLLLYSYCLYPIVLVCLSDGKSHLAEEPSADWPFVSVILSVYNEESCIEKKIKNFLDSTYPGRRELLIVSDGSTDRTAELAATFHDNRIRLLVSSQRCGKGSAINRAIDAASGEILAFTDANAYFSYDALTELVRPFFHPTVGLVTGCSHYQGTIGSLYQRYERFLKGLEARSGVVATADGAIYAMRRTLWHPHDPGLINDFYHPMMVNMQGARAVIAADAICNEEFRVTNEFARQVRMVAQASFVYFKMIPHLMRAGCWRSVLILTSHKLLRWLTLPLLVLLLAATVCVAGRSNLLMIALACELAFVLCALAGAVARIFGLSEKFTVAYHFVSLNWAATVGLWRCLIGTVPLVWQPRGD